MISYMASAMTEESISNPGLNLGQTVSLVVGCPKCQTRFRLSADKARSEGRRLRCTACGHVWLERFGFPEAEQLLAPSADPANETEPPQEKDPPPQTKQKLKFGVLPLLAVTLVLFAVAAWLILGGGLALLASTLGA